ncbi:ROK family transcriptional regulator [Phyllobacterium sp. YR531]|uniref:ROK family transcriptional regulator n=1 Tax=Phyllobacterium sp. YR531 TaxID=1144343 RepID=UPI00026F87AF|nr:ROK family transcriptional regulator [Phyllobacterium sp. YR531]EJM98426.1 transcriptional regulator/sugar kinase [Phyllobacterium sp. YR531]
MFLTIDETAYEDAHQRDCARVAALLSGEGPHSRASVADRLKMTSTATSHVVGDLTERGLVMERPGTKVGRGRPPIGIALNLKRLGASIIHISSRTLLGFLLDLGGTVLEHKAVEIPADSDNAAMAEAMRQLVQWLINKCPVGMLHLGTSVAVPGVVDVKARTWLITSRWPKVRNLDIGNALAPVTPVVLVCRHLDAELDARTTRETAYRSGNTLLLHWGWGIGLSCSIGGQPLLQNGGPFGEIGHWRFNALDQRECDCGNHGCLETGAALWALLPHLRKLWPNLSEEEEPLAGQLAGLPLLDIPEMAEAIKLMARSLTNVCRLLFPSRVIITGPFVANADVWEAFTAAFKTEGLIGSLELPALIADKFSQEYVIHGACLPLLNAGLESFIRENKRAA